MKSRKIWMGMLVFVLVFGITVVGCDNGTTNGSGTPKDVLDGTTWTGSFDGINNVLTFNSPNYTLVQTGAETGTMTGTYTVSNNVVTLFLDNEPLTTGTLSGNSLDFRGDGGPLFTKQ